jgi:hypothetical protein
MTITAVECLDPILNLFTFSGVIKPAELDQVLVFHASRKGGAAGRDEVLLFEAGTDMSMLTADTLRGFKRALGATLRGVQTAMVVRTALVCHAPGCLPALEAWAHLSAPNDGFHTEVRLFDTVSEATAWIGLNSVEAARVGRHLRQPLRA